MSKNKFPELGADIQSAFPENIQENVSLSRFTSSRIGGPADYLATVHSASQLEELAKWLWERNLEFVILGGGSNVLISDAGIRGVTILNHARSIRFESKGSKCLVSVESGANLGALARQAAQNEWSGLEWAAGIPGTVGGAIVGNAGAHGGDMADVTVMADILHRSKGRQTLSSAELKFEYRSSYLKKISGQAVVLASEVSLVKKANDEIQSEMDRYLKERRKSQPPGASMGSMFKNPTNDFAGRLIEEAGLKGKRIGEAQISPLHGNFFLNLGKAKAKDVYQLIFEARSAVERQYGILLELEIGLLGEGFSD